MHQEDIDRIEKEHGKITEIGPSFPGPTSLEDGSETLTTFTPLVIGGKRRVFNSATRELQ